MSKLTKKQKILQEKHDVEKMYSLNEAMKIIQSVKSEKFDESIDIAVKLGVDPNQSDQNVRGAVTLPNSLGKEVVGKLGQLLGPKGLMPNPKTGTVSDDVTTAIKNVKAGQVRFRTDKNGIIHGSIGKVTFDSEKIKANASALLEELNKLKPASAKGIFVGNISISSTMGPGIKINPGELV